MYGVPDCAGRIAEGPRECMEDGLRCQSIQGGQLEASSVQGGQLEA
jgi:hypothetical protein